MSDIHDLLGAYVTDALEPGERAQFEAHLADCPQCRAESADLREVLAALADADPVRPPADLEDKVVRRARAGAGTTTPAPPEPAPLAPDELSNRRRRRDWARSAPWLAAAACGGLLFAGGYTLGQGQEAERAVAAPEGQVMSDIVSVAAAPDATVLPVDIMGTTSRVVASDEMDKSVFLASALPMPAKGMCYQVWRVTDDGQMVSAGSFTPAPDGHVAVVLDGGAGDVAKFMITMEPPGGSTHPTGEMLAEVRA